MRNTSPFLTVTGTVEPMVANRKTYICFKNNFIYLAHETKVDSKVIYKRTLKYEVSKKQKTQ